MTRTASGPLIGDPVPNWTARPLPPHHAMQGRTCRLEPLDEDRHARSLFLAFAAAADDGDWTYLPDERPSDAASYRQQVSTRAASRDPLFYAVVLPDGCSAGTVALMRIDPANGVIEIGHVNFAPALQRTAAGTEAVALLLSQAFALGYRRVEWKCDSLNARSRQAARRFGFSFEGIFRQAVVTKGRNRDTAWFSMLDREWPCIRHRIDRWLAPENFDADGRQIATLGRSERLFRDDDA